MTEVSAVEILVPSRPTVVEYLVEGRRGPKGDDGAGGITEETDPVATAALAFHDDDANAHADLFAGIATALGEKAEAGETQAALDALSTDLATKASSADLTTATATLEAALAAHAAGDATDAELAQAIADAQAASSSALALKQDAATAATDSELAAESSARASADSAESVARIAGDADLDARKAEAAPPEITVVSEMESGWVDNGGNGSIAFDTGVYLSGEGSLRIDCASDGDQQSARIAFAAEDWTRQVLKFRIRSDDWARVTDSYLLVSTSGVFGAYFICQLQPRMQRKVDDEWLEFTLTASDFEVGGGSPSWGTVNGLVLRFYATSGQTPSVWVDQMVRFDSRPRGIVSITFDDSYLTDLTVGAPKLAEHGFRSTHFVIPEKLGDSGFLSQAQVDALHSMGFDISGHGDPDLTTLTSGEVEVEVSATRAYLAEHGYRGQDLFAYPLGGRSAAIEEIMRRYYRAARGTSTLGQTRDHPVRHNLMCRQVGQANTVSQVEDWIDAAAANGDWLILAFHRLRTPTVDPEDATPANYEAIIDYLATVDVDVLPVSEVLDHAPTDSGLAVESAGAVGAPAGTFDPTRQGLLGASCDPALISAGQQPSSGVGVNFECLIAEAGTISTVVLPLTAGGSGLTSGSNWVAVYNDAGTLIGKSADQTTAFASSGIKEVAITAEAGQSLSVEAGDRVIIQVIATGTTRPQLFRTTVNATASGDTVNYGLSGAARRAFVTPSVTSPPSSLGSGGSTYLMFFAGVK